MMQHKNLQFGEKEKHPNQGRRLLTDVQYICKMTITNYSTTQKYKSIKVYPPTSPRVMSENKVHQKGEVLCP